MQPRRFLSCLLIAAALPGCDGPELPSPEGEPACRGIAGAGRAPDPPGVVLIVNDTMRGDRPGILGGSASTPAFDAFAREGWLFERAVTQSPWTKPAIASLFTSLHPSQHGVADDPGVRDRREGSRGGALLEADVLSDDLVTLAEVLRAAGFRTAAFVSNPWLGASFGFAQGFDHYDDSFAAWDAPGRVVSEAALAWLRGVGPDQPFFVYLHYIDSHRPYGRLSPAAVAAVDRNPEGRFEPGSEGDELVRRSLRLTDGRPATAVARHPSRSLVERAYDRGVENFDRALGALLRELEDSPVWERSAVIVTSDHGEALFTRGYGNHGGGFYDDETRIPFALRLPGVQSEPQRLSCMVGLVDVMPSLCAYLGIDCPPGLAGWSFVSPPQPEDARRYLVTEGVMGHPTHRLIQDARYKLFFEPDGPRDAKAKRSPYSLFDLETDPAEAEDLVGWLGVERNARGVLDEMQTALHAVADEAPPRRVERVPLDAETRERLEQLGYAEPGAAPTEEPGEAPAAEPAAEPEDR